jgi:hypothetical protein
LECISREQNEIMNNELPLLYVLIQISQEVLVNYIFNDELESDVLKAVNLASTIKDSHESISKLPEGKIMEKIDAINQLHQRFKDMFQFESKDNQKCKMTSSIRDSLGELMHSQINLLKVYNNTPLEKFNQTVETWFPVMAAIYLLRQIIKLGDVLFA